MNNFHASAGISYFTGEMLMLTRNRLPFALNFPPSLDVSFPRER